MELDYLHIYNRGIDRRAIFREPADYFYMMTLFDRYLTENRKFDSYSREYPNYSRRLSLLSFCLMPNHLHLEIEMRDPLAAQKFMQSLKTAYAKYYNRKYKNSGYVFESRYHRRLLNAEADILHLSRYVHLNPLALSPDYESYPYSSLHNYLNSDAPAWLKTEPILSYFESVSAYRQFHEDYVRDLAKSTFERELLTV